MGFYRRFICGYALIARTLNALLKKGEFSWSSKNQAAFDALKRAMTNALVLALLDFSLPFVLEMDTSGTAMGVVLMQ